MIKINNSKIVYGQHNLSREEVLSFAEWLQQRNHPAGGMLTRWQGCECTFNALWLEWCAATAALQGEYVDLMKGSVA